MNIRMSNAAVSVIIITYNRAHKILNVLKALEKQSFKNFELVIIIDGSTDKTKEVIESANLDFQEIRVIEQPNGGRSVARNNGAGNATGDILIFFDDDMRPFPNCVELHVRHHELYPGSICIGTQEEDPEDTKYDYQKYRLHLSQKWSAAYPPYGTPMTKEQTYFTTGNCSIAKKDFIELGGFDPRVIDVEDFELGARAVNKGVKIYFNSHARAYHDDLDIFSKFVSRQRDYARNYKRLSEMMPQYKNKFIATQEYNPSAFKKFVFSVLAQPALVKSIDKYDWLKFVLPKQTRFMLYSLMTTGLARVYKDRKLL